jgi:hypothetical protein
VEYIRTATQLEKVLCGKEKIKPPACRLRPSRPESAQAAGGAWWKATDRGEPAASIAGELDLRSEYKYSSRQ